MAIQVVWPPWIQAGRELWQMQRETEHGLRDTERFPVVKRETCW